MCKSLQNSIKQVQYLPKFIPLTFIYKSYYGFTLKIDLYKINSKYFLSSFFIYTLFFLYFIHSINYLYLLFKHMGNLFNKQNQIPKRISSNSIVAATLNFSGICLSPFEYHDSTVQKDILSNTFSTLQKKYIPDQKFNWDVGKIDLKMQHQRYTPVYRKDVCVVSGKLVDKKQFDKLWDLQFQKNRGVLSGNPPNQKQINEAKLFDWIAYETFLNQTYRQNPKLLIDLAKIKSFDAIKFIAFLEKWHSKPYLDNHKKMQRVVEFLKSDQVDVLFLQQAEIKSDRKWEQIVPKKYGVQKQQKSESLIIYNKQKFPINKQENKKFKTQYNDLLNIHGDTAFIKNQKFLLVSSHLSSKQAVSKQQVQKLKLAFKKIRQLFPKIDIICGVDANRFISPQDWNAEKKIYQFAPENEMNFTTSKKRTAVQLQTSKVNKIVIEAKDQIISTLKMVKQQKPKKPWVGMLDGGESNEKVYLPNAMHPFDHFMVCSQFIARQN